MNFGRNGSGAELPSLLCAHRPCALDKARVYYVMTERQLAAIERARHTPAVIVTIKRDRKRNLSFSRQELIELQQGGWAYAERDRLIKTWGA
jgi:hypothetical protein